MCSFRGGGDEVRTEERLLPLSQEHIDRLAHIPEIQDVVKGGSRLDLDSPFFEAADVLTREVAAGGRGPEQSDDEQGGQEEQGNGRWNHEFHGEKDVILGIFTLGDLSSVPQQMIISKASLLSSPFRRLRRRRQPKQGK